MAISRVKTWSAGEVLTASDLNAEFNNLLNNPVDLWSPAGKAADFNGFEVILDADADTSITADTDDRIDLRLGAVDLFVFNGTTSSCVNGLTFFATATGTPAYIRANGSDSNTGIDLRDANGNEILKAAAVGTAVNEFTITNAATGNKPRLGATGGDTNVGMSIRPQGTGAGAVVVLEDGGGNEVLATGVATASAVTFVTVTNAATGNPPRIHATGESNVSLQIEPVGTGTILLTDGSDTTKKVSLVLSGITTATTRVLTMGDADFTIRAATQAEQEAASSNAVPVTPGRQHYHPAAAKAWVAFNGTGTPAILASYNVTSITDNGSGDYTINFTNAFSSGNFGTSGLCNNTSNGDEGVINYLSSATGNIRLTTKRGTTATVDDCSFVSVTCYGDQ